MKYNAFRYLDDLKDAGVPAKQAEVMAKGLTEFAESELATKRDIKELELKIETVRKEIDNVGRDIKASQGTQTVQILGGVAAIIAIFRFLPEFFKQ